MLPSRETIRSVAIRNFRESIADRDIFSRLVREDIKDLGYSQLIVAIVLRLALMLFDYYFVNGITEEYPESFLTLYSQTEVVQ